MIPKIHFVRAFFEAALPAWLALAILMWVGRGNIGLLGLAALFFPGAWGALRLQAPAGGWFRRIGYYLAFCAAQGMGVVAIVVDTWLLLKSTGQEDSSGGFQVLVFMWSLAGVSFLLVRGGMALPSAFRRWSWRAVLVPSAGFAALVAIAAGGYWWASQPYASHAAFSEPRILTASLVTDRLSTDNWRASDPSVMLREENGALHVDYSATRPFFYTLTWDKPGALPRADGLRVRARSDTATSITVELEEVGGGKYRSWADLPAGDWKPLVLGEWLPSLLAQDENAQLDWEQVQRVTLYIYLETVGTGLWLDKIEAVTLDHSGEVPWQVTTSQHWLIRYHPSEQSVAADVERSAENQFERITRTVGYQPKGRIPITIVSSHAELEQRIGIVKPAWSIANAFPDSLDILTPRLYSQWFNNHDYDDIFQLVPHELTHLLIGQVVGYPGIRQMPMWINEGIATYLAGQGSDQRAIRKAAREGKLPSLQELEKPFRELAQPAIGYSMAGSVMEYLAETYGAERIALLLKALKGGLDFNTSLVQVIGIDRSSLEQQWQAWLVKKGE